MICVSLQNLGAERIEAILDEVEMAEVRMDSCPLGEEQIESIFSSDTPIVATCRVGREGSWMEAERLLTLAIKAGARYVDLEIEAPKPVSKRLAQACAQWGTTMIRSWHDFAGTPSLDELRAMADKCRHHDGAVVKIATTATCPEDAERVLALYKYYTPESLIAFAMGPEGQYSRLECLRRGAPLSYAYPDGGQQSAPGQYSYSNLYTLVYGDRKPLCGGTVRMPSSKSYAQRSIIAAALARGTSLLHGYTPCSDSEAAIGVARSLGATVTVREDCPGAAGCHTGTDGNAAQTGCPSTLEITGIDARPGCLDRPEGMVLNVGESGLLTRLMMPLGSQLCTGPVRIEGCGTLLERPLDGAEAAMEALGGTVAAGGSGEEAPGHADANAQGRTEEEGEERSGRRSAVKVPLTVQGPMKAGRITMDGSRTSQIVSGAMMALPLSARNSSVSVNSPASLPYIYMTADLLRKFGVKVRSEMYGGRQLLDQEWDRCTEVMLKIKENQTYRAAEVDIEGDWSAAAPFLVAGAVFGQVSLEGLDTSSLQADLTMLDILMDAGASLSQLDEPKGTITVRKSPLQAFGADLRNSPDLFPAAAVLCAFCQGRSTLKGVHRLHHKESDRAAAITRMLAALGVKASVSGDTMTIEGESLATRIMNGRLLHGGSFSSHGDHRMVMALQVAALGADGPVVIDDTACVAKSFPQFNDIWNEHIRK